RPSGLTGGRGGSRPPAGADRTRTGQVASGRRFLTSIPGAREQRAGSPPPRRQPREWLAPPCHHAAVPRLRTAAQGQERPALAASLHPGVTVAVTAVHDGQEDTIVARGTRDAAPVLLHGFRGGPDVVVSEQAVNGQAGLAMTGQIGRAHV